MKFEIKGKKIYIPDNYVSTDVKYAFARTLARKIYMLLDCSIPVNIMRILREFDVDVMFDYKSILTEKMDAAFLPVKREYSNGLIIIRKIPERRMRFTLAHELYHALLRPKTISFMMPNELLKTHEREANIFASELLMPKQKVYEAYSNGYNTPEKIANLFLVSLQAAKIRLKELNLLS